MDRSCYHSALVSHLFWHTWQGIHLFLFSWQPRWSQHRTCFLDINTNHWSLPSCSLHHAPRVASFLTMCNFLHRYFCQSIALNLILTTYTLSPTFPNFLSSLQRMEPMPSLVRNHIAKQNQEGHLGRALAFEKAANLHCLSNVWLPIICLHALNCGWLLLLMHWWIWMTILIRGSVRTKVRTL